MEWRRTKEALVGILDMLYQVLASPGAAFGVVSEKRPLGWALITAVLSSVVFTFVFLPNPSQLVEAIFGLERGALNIAPLVLVWLSLFPLVLLLLAGLYHLVAWLLRGRGSYLGMFCGLCFASFPLVFLAPLALIRALMDSDFGQLVYFGGALVVIVWALVLGVTAVRRNYRFLLGRAVATFVIPILLVFVVPVLVVAISTAF